MQDPELGVPSSSAINKLSLEEKSAMAAEFLKQIEPGFLPLDLFTELSRLMVINTVELVPLHQNNEELAVLLTKRPKTDIWWPNQWHIPGTVVLPTDPVDNHVDFGGSINRIIDNELAGIKLKGDINFLEAQRRVGPRGHEIALVHWAEFDTLENMQGLSSIRTFNSTDLVLREPRLEVVEGHRSTIAHAMSAYRKTQD